jgi:hypothetical protein
VAPLRVALCILTFLSTVAAPGFGESPTSSVQPVQSASLRAVLGHLCATEAKAEQMLWDPASGGASAFGLTVAMYRQAATVVFSPLQNLAGALYGLSAGPDEATVRVLGEDVGQELMSRSSLTTVLDSAAANSVLDLNAQPVAVVSAYRAVTAAYLKTSTDAIAAGVPECAIPLRTVSAGPGSDEASGATVVERIASPCPELKIAYTYSGVGGPAEPSTLSVSPGKGATGFDGTPYAGGSGPLSFAPGAFDVVIVHNDKYAITSLTCEVPASTPVPSQPTAQPPQPAPCVPVTGGPAASAVEGLSDASAWIGQGPTGTTVVDTRLDTVAHAAGFFNALTGPQVNILATWMLRFDVDRQPLYPVVWSAFRRALEACMLTEAFVYSLVTTPDDSTVLDQLYSHLVMDLAASEGLMRPMTPDEILSGTDGDQGTRRTDANGLPILDNYYCVLGGVALADDVAALLGRGQAFTQPQALVLNYLSALGFDDCVSSSDLAPAVVVNLGPAGCARLLVESSLRGPSFGDD